MKIIKLDGCEFELLKEVFNDAISYATFSRKKDKTVKDYRWLLANLIIQTKSLGNHG